MVTKRDQKGISILVGCRSLDCSNFWRAVREMGSEREREGSFSLLVNNNSFSILVIKVINFFLKTHSHTKNVCFQFSKYDIEKYSTKHIFCIISVQNKCFHNIFKP